MEEKVFWATPKKIVNYLKEKISPMKQPKFGPIILACGLFVGFMACFIVYIDHYMGKVTDVGNLASVYEKRKFDGLLIEKKALSGNDFLYILDSSNLSNIDCSYHPANVFKGKATGFIPYLCGRDAISSIYHVLKIAALADSMRDRKIVYLAEPANFIGHHEGGGGFSSLQAYQFVLYSGMSQNLKAAIASGLLKNPEIYKDPVLAMLLKELTYRRPHQTVVFLLKPVARLILGCLRQIDCFNAYQLVVANRQKPYPSARRTTPDWPALLRSAEKDGAKACRTNRFGMEDKQYNENIRPNIQYFRKQAKNRELNRREINDFQLLLCLFKELKIKPLIIIDPVNGLWSDSIGLSKETRYRFYREVQQMVRKSGFEYADMSSHEYEKYILHDTKHLGWKGWVYVDREMDRFYHQ